MPIWLVEITMQKDLIADIRSGSIELEGQELDLEDLDLGYEEDLAQAAEVDANDVLELNSGTVEILGLILDDKFLIKI